MAMQAWLETPNGGRAGLDELLGRRTDAGTAVDHVDPDALSVCSVCGCAVAEEEIEDTNGWRWYSDGRGGLHSLCATCPVPTLLVVRGT